MLVDQRFALFDRRAFANRDEPFARCHDVADRLIKVGFKTQITVGDNTHHLQAIKYRETRNFVLPAQFKHFTHGQCWRDGNWILQDARLKTLDFGNFRGLRFWRKIFVYDANTTFLSQCNRQPALGDSIHGRRN